MMRIVLTGFMGCGKTTLGKLLAARLGYPFYDTDQLIEERLKLSVEDIFDRYGEDFFRRREWEVLHSLRDESPAVIATGGGALLPAANLDLLRKKSLIIFLKVSPEILWARVQNSSRPLAKDRQSFFKLYQKRNRFYRQLENQLKLSGCSLESDFQSLLEFLGRRKKKLVQRQQNKKCELHFLRFLCGLNREYLSTHFAQRRIFLLSDSLLSEHHRLTKVFPHWQHLALPGNEKSKNLKTVSRIWSWLVEKRIEREDILLAFGGGVICDLTGFAAATVLRGVRVGFVPTTLLAMADAAIGGKNGFDFQNGKNLIGTFYLPEKIFIDSTLLCTLGPAQMLDGLIEIIKAGLLGDQTLLDLLSRKKKLFLRRDLTFLEQIIYRAVKVKLAFLRNDLEERRGQRAMLNLGHTFGHALESVSEFKISHGRAVGYGILFSLLLACRLKILDKKEMRRAAGYLTCWLQPLRVNYSFDALQKAMELDKKAQQAKKRFILLSAIGSPLMVSVENSEILRETYEELLQWPF